MTFKYELNGAKAKASIGEAGVRVGLTLFGDHLTEEGACYASQLGVSDIVIHLTQYARNADSSAYRAGGVVGPVNGDCIDVPLLFGHPLRHARRLLCPASEQDVFDTGSPYFWRTPK